MCAEVFELEPQLSLGILQLHVFPLKRDVEFVIHGSHWRVRIRSNDTLDNYTVIHKPTLFTFSRPWPSLNSPLSKYYFHRFKAAINGAMAYHFLDHKPYSFSKPSQ
jgi:hypothetical protein